MLYLPHKNSHLLTFKLFPMNRIYTLLLLLCLAMGSNTAWAESISEGQARSIAEGFMASRQMSSTNMRLAKKQSRLDAPLSTDKAAYYVFNSARHMGGYVIVAGDDRAPAVLGYSDKGTFDAQDVPKAMQALLNGYAEQIEALERGAKAVTLTSPGPAISPLVTANWSQNAPYNIMLPILTNGNQAVAGCVATAMAQLLYYWKHPAQITLAIPEYTSQSLNIYMPALEPVDFNWEAMQDTYLTNDTESDGAIAAARLTLYCAQSVQMDFLYGASGANTTRLPKALSTYFGFKGSARCEYRENYSTHGWADLVYNELAEGRPVIYSGSKASGGHAFICDGYDGEGMFHINWGWNGMSNGYFLLNVLNPDAQGTGSANEAYGYIYDQYIVCGIEPGEGGEEFALTAGNVVLNDAVTTRNNSTEEFKAIVSGNFFNYTNQTINVSYGWGLYQENDLISVLSESYGNQLPSGYYFPSYNETLNFGKNITSGTYRIVPIYSELFANNWRPCKGGEINFIEVTIDGNNCTVIGYGMVGVRSYTVNSITYDGSLHHGRPVDLTLNLTNDGFSQNDLLYMFLNGTRYSTGFVGLEHGATGDVPFKFLPTTPGDYTCMFSFNQDGSDPLCYTTLTIMEMPVAELNITAEVLNITDPQNHIITSDKYSVKLTITNNGSETYFDDITLKLYKSLDGTYGSNAQILNQLVNIYPGETIEVRFDMDNVTNGWDYFAAIYYYSSGQQVPCTTTSYYTIVFPDVPEPLIGDVDGNDIINITDVTRLINYLLSHDESSIVISNTDIDGNGIINITDVTKLINMLLTGSH